MNKGEKLHTSTGYVTIRGGDWDYYRSIQDIADRIVSDQNFDKACKVFSKNRDKYNNNERVI